MSPAKQRERRDDLVTVLLERLDRFEASLTGVRETLVRMEEAEKQAREQAAEAVSRLDDHEARLASLEAGKHRAEGAAWAGKMLWAAGAAVAGAVGAFVHYVLR